jgi:hypothetical protein
MAQAVSRQPLTAVVTLCGIRGGQNDTGTGFSLHSSAFPCQYLSTIAPHSSVTAPCGVQ